MICFICLREKANAPAQTYLPVLASCFAFFAAFFFFKDGTNITKL
jgi:hypothetical protein